MNDAAPVHKITIIPRGSSGGHTAFIQNDGGWFEQDLWIRLCLGYGGYVGEEMYQGDNEVTTGPSGDFGQCTRLAKEMVLKDIYGHQRPGDGDVTHFTQDKKYEHLSEQERERVDRGIIELTNKAYNHCKTLLYEHRESMRVIAEALVKYDQITVEEMEAIVAKNSVDGGKHLRFEEDEEMNKKRFIKEKGMKPEDVPPEILAAVHAIFRNNGLHFLNRDLIVLY